MPKLIRKLDVVIKYETEDSFPLTTLITCTFEAAGGIVLAYGRGYSEGQAFRKALEQLTDYLDHEIEGS